MAISKPIPNITVPAGRENVSRQISNQGDYTESILNDIARATTNNEVVQARMGHDNLSQTLSAYYNHLPTVTYEGLTTTNTGFTFDKIVWYYKGRQVVKRNKTFSEINPVLLRKLSNTTGLGSKQSLGNVINTADIWRHLINLINTYLVNDITPTELDSILAGLGTAYTFEIGVGDRGYTSNFNLVTNWSGDDVRDLLLSPNLTILDRQYNFKLAFDKNAKHFVISDTYYGQENTFGAIRYFKVKYHLDFFIYFDTAAEDFTTIKNNHTIPVYYYHYDGGILYPVMSFFDYEDNHIPVSNTLSNKICRAWRADRSLNLHTVNRDVVVPELKTISNSYIDMRGLASKFLEPSININNSTIKNIFGIQILNNGYRDFSFSGTGNTFHLLEGGRKLVSNTWAGNSVDIGYDLNDDYYITLAKNNRTCKVTVRDRHAFSFDGQTQVIIYNWNGGADNKTVNIDVRYPLVLSINYTFHYYHGWRGANGNHTGVLSATIRDNNPVIIIDDIAELIGYTGGAILTSRGMGISFKYSLVYNNNTLSLREEVIKHSGGGLGRKLTLNCTVQNKFRKLIP